MALAKVGNNHLQFEQAATRFGVPKTTLYNKYREHSNKLGRPCELSKKEERRIVCAMITAAEYGYPLVKQDIKEFVSSYLTAKE